LSANTHWFDLEPYGLPGRRLYFSSGNTKVGCPIFSAGSATECPSRLWCPYDKHAFRKSGRRWCYAQKIESLRPKALAARNENARAILEIGAAGRGVGVQVSQALAREIYRVCRKLGRSYVRLNESGDLDWTNIEFLEALVFVLNYKYAIRVWTYSKANPQLQDALIKAGCVVLKSDVDFVCVRNKAEAKELGLPVCPGGCAIGCTRCPEGLRTAVIAH